MSLTYRQPAMSSPRARIRDQRRASHHLGVPLIREGRALGTILVRRTLKFDPLSKSTSRFLTTFRRSGSYRDRECAAVRRLQKRTSELTELLQQQTAISEVLKVISTSPGELEPVFQRNA